MLNKTVSTRWYHLLEDVEQLAALALWPPRFVSLSLVLLGLSHDRSPWPLLAAVDPIAGR